MRSALKSGVIYVSVLRKFILNALFCGNINLSLIKLMLKLLKLTVLG